MKDRSRLDHLRTRALSSRCIAMLGCVQIFSQNAFAQSSPQSAPVSVSVPVPVQVPVTASSLLRSITTLGPRVRYRLANGLDVILEENHRLPEVAIRMVYHVGSRDNPPRYTGLAHTVEHMMFERAARGQQRFFFELARLGAFDANAETGPDSTEYRMVVPPQHVLRALWMESDRMANLLRGLNEERIASEKRAVRNEFRIRVEGRELRRFGPSLRRALYPVGHPYRQIDETEGDLDAIGVQEIQWFFQRWYAPNYATLIVVGDFDTATVRASIERYFGPIVPAPTVERPRPAMSDVQDRNIALTTSTNHEGVGFFWPTPRMMTDDDAALDVVAAMMEDELQDSLAQRLVARFGADASLSVRQDSQELQSEFSVFVSVPEGRTPREMLEVLQQEMRLVRRQLLTDEQLDHFRREQIQRLALWQETNTLRAERLALYTQFTPNLQTDADLTMQDAQRYVRLTPQSVQAVAARWLGTRNRVTVVIQRQSRAMLNGQ